MKMIFNLLIIIFFLINKLQVLNLFSIELFWSKSSILRRRVQYGQYCTFLGRYVSDNVRYFNIFSSLLWMTNQSTFLHSQVFTRILAIRYIKN